MNEVADLLERPVYAIPQVDELLGLKPGTARRWIEGYERGRKSYPPVIREESTGREEVTWGEFVETRLLAEYRDAGVPLIRMRPAIERLREEIGTPYPLAVARPYVALRELVLRVQEEVNLASRLRLVVIRNDQVMLTPPAEDFYRSAEFEGEDGAVTRLRPASDIRQVFFDPLRHYGEPVVRSVPTDVIREQFQAGERIEAIAELYELAVDDVQAAIRYELGRGAASGSAA
jgi:uncharacterized protein (DUF433 family)